MQLILDVIAAIDEKVEVLTRVEEYARPIAAGGSTTLSLAERGDSLKRAREKSSDRKIMVDYWEKLKKVRSAHNWRARWSVSVGVCFGTIIRSKGDAQTATMRLRGAMYLIV